MEKEPAFMPSQWRVWPPAISADVAITRLFDDFDRIEWIDIWVYNAMETV